MVESISAQQALHLLDSLWDYGVTPGEALRERLDWTGGHEVSPHHTRWVALESTTTRWVGFKKHNGG